MTTSVAAVLADAAARRPDHPAVIHDSEHFTYGWLWDQARRYASLLRADGVRPGDQVAVLLADTPRFPIAYFGVLAAGAVAVPLSVLSTAAEIRHVLTDAGLRFLATDNSSLPQAEEAAERLGTVLLAVDPDNAENTDPIDGFESRAPDDVAVVFYTSGTTGKPKGVMLTHRNIMHNVEGMITTPYAFRSDDVLLGCLPLSHGFGQICGMLTGFRAGISIVLMSKFSGRDALALMAEHRCTVFMGVPTMYFGLLDAVHRGGPVPDLDRVFSGGSALPVKTLDDVRSTFGCPVYEGYGMTETSCSVAYHYPGLPFRPGTVGVPVNDVTVGITLPNAGGIELLPVGEVGEIVVSGPTVMAGYLGRPDLTAEVLVGGWFRTGDLGRLDDDGYLSVVGRKKDLIVRGGYNVHPREIEEVLVQHPAVAQVAVIGVPHLALGEEVWAVVVPARPEDVTSGSGDEIVEWARKRVAAYKYPRRVEFTDALPTGPSGKVLKRLLVSKYE
ncbi:AMP-binding protein [Lentzea californiensis]|uniref:AMP-binding protein n=1 Tax=Lentzea californiensis TaxID=438851 RepID=UPI002165CA55|nr:AMP-binding protein [Lentzea californiensis]MCR3752123.1 long-chain acyl-CoA synthetase [Lentzea californiensis]